MPEMATSDRHTEHAEARPERARWPRLAAAPHPRLRDLTAQDLVAHLIATDELLDAVAAAGTVSDAARACIKIEVEPVSDRLTRNFEREFLKSSVEADLFVQAAATIGYKVPQLHGQYVRLDLVEDPRLGTYADRTTGAQRTRAAGLAAQGRRPLEQFDRVSRSGQVSRGCKARKPSADHDCVYMLCVDAHCLLSCLVVCLWAGFIARRT